MLTVKRLAEALNANRILMPEPNREVTGGYTGDLLSWVMGRAQSGDAWVTIMSNVNVAAVAQLSDTAVVVFAEGVVPDEAAVRAASLHDINLISVPEGAFAVCAAIARMLEV